MHSHINAFLIHLYLFGKLKPSETVSYLINALRATALGERKWRLESFLKDNLSLLNLGLSLVVCPSSSLVINYRAGQVSRDTYATSGESWIMKLSKSSVSGTLSHKHSLTLSTIFASSFSSSSNHELSRLPSKPIICKQAH